MSKTKILKKPSKAKSIFLGFLVALFALLAAGMITAALLLNIWLRDLPELGDLTKYTETGISTIYASDKKTVLAEISYENRIEVSKDEISQYAKDALVAIEDERFYEHGAIDPIAMARAVVSTLSGTRQGASTLTQQLARNTVLLDEMDDATLERKAREAYIAFEIENRYSKDEILTLYLNVVNFSNADYGIEAAAQDYFGVSAKDLSLAQAAFLVAIPNSPATYNPRTNFDGVVARQHLVLKKMLELGFIEQEQYDEAMNEELVVSPDTIFTDKVSPDAPYFVDYVKSLLSTDTKYNLRSSKGGNKIYTTLDIDGQKAAVSAIEEVMEDMDLDASLTAIEPQTGYIVAMVGGRNYAENNFNLSTQMSRQPGSTFKPFTLIAAMQEGIDPSTTYDATSPAEITDSWTVNNAEGDGYGRMSISKATTNSVNTVYARLAHDIGAQPIIDTAHALGIKSNLTNDETITLGTSGVNTLEMASAYATIASEGVYREPIAITKIEDDAGNTVYEIDDEDTQGTQVISPAIAAKATEIMETVITSGTGRAARLDNGQVAAGKTGTSEHGRDLWFCAFTPNISCAVWTGYRDETPTKLYGGSTSVPIWKKYVEAVMGDSKPEDFDMADTDELVFPATNPDAYYDMYYEQYREAQ